MIVDRNRQTSAVCCHCGAERPLENFATHPKRGPHWVSDICGECVRSKERDRSRKWYRKNGHHARSSAKVWYRANREQSRENRMRYAKTTRGRAVMLLASVRNRGKECDLTAEWIEEKIAAGVCSVSGIQFNLGARGHHPMTPSIDRIDHSKGYTMDNCRVVAFIFNLARNQFDDGAVLELSRAMVKKHGA